jgi:hypothetical protein
VVTWKAEKGMWKTELERILEKWRDRIKVGYRSGKADGYGNTGRVSIIGLFPLHQCCATFLHSRHISYCRWVMAAHQPHLAYCGGGGGDGCVTFQFHLVDLLCLTIITKIKTETEQKTR